MKLGHCTTSLEGLYHPHTDRQTDTLALRKDLALLESWRTVDSHGQRWPIYLSFLWMHYFKVWRPCLQRRLSFLCHSEAALIRIIQFQHFLQNNLSPACPLTRKIYGALSLVSSSKNWLNIFSTLIHTPRPSTLTPRLVSGGTDILTDTLTMKKKIFFLL